MEKKQTYSIKTLYKDMVTNGKSDIFIEMKLVAMEWLC